MLVLALVLGAALPVASAVARTSVVEVRVAGPRDLRTLSALGFDVDTREDLRGGRARLVVSSAAERARLGTAFAVREVIADYEARLARWAAEDRARAGGRSALPSGRDTYRVPRDYEDELDGLARDHPGLARRVDLPRRSVEGRLLAGIELGRGVDRADDGRPVMVVTGLHHAREWPSAEIAMEFALDLARGADGDPRISALLDRVRVLVFPVVNPDGFVVSRGENPLLPAGPQPLRRKNCAPVGEAERALACPLRSGVDLNRNAGAYWGGPGAGPDPSSDTYRGPAPWSEPESAAVHELSQRLHVTNFQSLHNVAALVLRPPGFRALGLAPDEPRLRALGDAMATAAGYASQYGYELYEVTGATEDWNYVAQNAFGYTIETGGDTFQGPYATHVVDQYLGRAGTPHAGRGVREALLLAAEQAADPTDHAVLEGAAPAGSVLRLRRTFTTPTSPICRDAGCSRTDPPQALPDGLDTRTVVGADGRFTWHVTPSTRPFERKAGRSEAWELVCETPGGTVVARTLVIGPGARRAVDPCVPVPPEAPVVAPPVGAPPADGAAPSRPRLRVTLRAAALRLRTFTRRGVRVRIGCSAPCTVRLSARAGGRVVAAAPAKRLPRGGRAFVRLRPGPVGRSRVRRARPARLALRAVAGRRAAARGSVRLGRR